MSRILMTWEMGLNLGHLTRLLPLAVRLKSRGHVVLSAVCDIPSAASVFGPAGIPFVQVPRLTNGMRLSHRPGAYADVLLLHGWGDRNALWGLVQAWLSLFQLFKPELMVLDHSPTALLAARIAKIKTGLIGNGFELPPATNPLPAFPGFSWASDEKAAESERIAVDNANAVARAFGGSPITDLRDLFDVEASLLTSFPELDHYGARPGAKYVGPLQGQPACEPITWPEGQRRIFAYIRPDTEGAEAILGALAACGASVVCFAPGFTQEQLQRYRTPNMRFSSKPVELKPLLQDADACVSYGAEGTVAGMCQSL